MGEGFPGGDRFLDIELGELIAWKFSVFLHLLLETPKRLGLLRHTQGLFHLLRNLGGLILLLRSLAGAGQQGNGQAKRPQKTPEQKTRRTARRE